MAVHVAVQRQGGYHPDSFTLAGGRYMWAVHEQVGSTCGLYMLAVQVGSTYSVRQCGYHPGSFTLAGGQYTVPLPLLQSLPCLCTAAGRCYRCYSQLPTAACHLNAAYCHLAYCKFVLHAHVSPAAGGATKSDLWLQIHADVSNLPLRLTE